MILNLQYVRAFAAIIVVMFHITVNDPGGIAGSAVYTFFNNWGAAGVDLFFVLSGFIMVYVQDRAHRGARDFLTERVIRIVPLYWFVTLGWCAILLVGSAQFRSTYFDPMQVLTSLGFVSHPAGYTFPFIVPGWTLEYEALFYLIFAASLLAFRERYFLPLLVAVALASLPGATTPILLEFTFGMVAAKIYNRPAIRRAAPALFILGATAFVWTAFGETATVDSNDRGWMRVLYWGLPGLLIITALAGLKQVKAPIALFLGNASYSIYLCHPVGIKIYKGVIERVPVIDGLASTLLCLMLNIALGCACYVIFEKPVTRALKARRKARLAARGAT